MHERLKTAFAEGKHESATTSVPSSRELVVQGGSWLYKAAGSDLSWECRKARLLALSIPPSTDYLASDHTVRPMSTNCDLSKIVSSRQAPLPLQIAASFEISSNAACPTRMQLMLLFAQPQTTLLFMHNASCVQQIAYEGSSAADVLYSTCMRLRYWLHSSDVQLFPC